MTDSTSPVLSDSVADTGAPLTAGAMLRAGREAMGLSQDAVAQQLKLAPRQVTALEEGDFARLPGRTFVRGFLRNYARLVRVDPEAVLAALAGGDAPAPDSPALHATAPTIGLLPTTDHAKPGWTRWGIPLTLVAVIATAAVYEFTRGKGDAQRAPAAPVVSPPAAGEPERPAPPKPAPAAGETALPNPIAIATPGAEPGGKADAAAPSLPTAAPTAASTAQPDAAPNPPGPVTAEATLVLTFRDASWTEVKDGSGRVLVSQMIPGGQSRAIAGTPPFDVVIGNAAEVRATFRGQPLDLVAVTQKNVARFIVE